ncbi:hypothetical protein [Vibrio litoralis]|uniref:hypothetical protein n=1 Tax=Vibrio litoralis TaxID=335972 RepID=UPI000400E49B|nr:hypothetical protein [Vibrio litoralis]
MFKMIQSMFQTKPNQAHSSPKSSQNDAFTAQEIEQNIRDLEVKLKQDEASFDTQKKLMIEYNKALKVFAKTPNYQHKVDDLFIKMDELRNTTRKNF